jgi:phosphopantothenoylcysteine decarboxylase/phosphopantothenate--cysteine ligase|uniref:Coenzyme A biosynthesis bifunctional protein CoaBC n=1 Tax=Mesoaciditoga lauensis TaxID=1495039 RepID=A0A7V3RDG6_9BACT
MKVLLGISGGIAVYKALDIVSTLRKRRDEIKVLMTENATKFVSPLTFSSVGNTEVFVNAFEFKEFIPHTALSSWADILIVAPATANTIAKLAYGIADNIVTMTSLAFNGPKLIVPSMNVRMYENPVTMENMAKLSKLGWKIIEPDTGHLADGEYGKGRYPSNERIIFEIDNEFSKKDLSALRILVSAGPTREAIDPVRYITNRSSGKMGYAIARAAIMRGAEVDLVSGPVNLEVPFGVKKYDVESAEEMGKAIFELSKKVDLIIMSAAVADYKPSKIEPQKIKKVSDELDLHLTRTVDILDELSKIKKPDQFIVGFAAETENIVENSKRKLESKKIDMIIANDVSRKDIGFDSNYDEVDVFFKEAQPVHIDRMDKNSLANKLLDLIVEQRCKRI